MATTERKRRLLRRILWALFALLTLLIVAVVVAANVYVEPMLRNRLQTLIVEGSDSLYNYQLGSLQADFFGGNVEVSDLKIALDSNRYNQIKQRKALPSLVIQQLNVGHAHIRGLRIFSLLLSRKIKMDEIFSGEADVILIRHPKQKKDSITVTNKEPLWKVIQPKIKDVIVKRIRLDGIKLSYKNAEASEAKLQFDRCDVLVTNIRIDSAATQDTSRLGYIENFSFQLHDIKFRTSDSTYKLNAKQVAYNSAQRSLQVDSFQLQPTVSDTARNDTMRKSWYTVLFDKVNFYGLRLDRYLRLDRAEGDSVIFQNLNLSVYMDEKGLKNYESKIGRYPHQILLNAQTYIDVKKIAARNMQVVYTEREAVTRELGTINLNDINLTVENIVNDTPLIKKNPVSMAQAEGKIFGSPIKTSFRFYLDSSNGRFDVNGHIENVTAAQINPVANTLGNVDLPSVQINSLDFFVRGEDFGATADVQMLYNNLSLILYKRNKETGESDTRKFLTKILNRFGIHPFNNAGSTERKATGVRVARLTTQTFFGIIWRAVFEGMQRIMLKA